MTKARAIAILCLVATSMMVTVYSSTQGSQKVTPIAVSRYAGIHKSNRLYILGLKTVKELEEIRMSKEKEHFIELSNKSSMRYIEERIKKKADAEAKKKQQELLARVTPSRGQVSETIIMRATAYGETLLNGGSGEGITCTGIRPVEGRTIAADRRILPMGTKVYLECPTYPQINGYHLVEDVGGAIKGNRIDVYFNDLDNPPREARKRILDFGVRKVILTVVKD